MAASLQLSAYEVPQSINMENNTSQLFVQLVIVTTGGTYNKTGDTTGVITVNGRDYSLDGKDVERNTATVLYEQTHTVTHTADGTKSVTVVARFDPNTPATSEMTATETVILTPIARASTIAATDADIGAVSMVAVNRRSSNYSHSIRWQFGTLSGWLKADGTVSETEERFPETTVAFQLPESFYDEIPESPTGICTLSCVTYSGEGTVVGEVQSVEFTVTANSRLCGPRLSLTVVDENPVTLALTGDETVLVRHASTARCAVLAVAGGGAYIAQTRVAGQLLEEPVLSIPNFSADSVDASVTDSRGYMAATRVFCRPVPYIPLTANIIAGRTDPTSGRAVVNVKGICYMGSFGAQSNTLQITCRVGNEEYPMEPVFEDDGYRAELVLEGLDYQQSHGITVAVSDKLATLTKTDIIGKGIPVFDWGEGDFRFHVPVRVPAPTAEDHAVNKAWAVARSGDVMTGALAAPLLMVQADGYPGVYICRANGSVMGTLSAGDDHGCIYLTNNNGSAYEAYFTPRMTPGREGGAVYDLLTSKVPVAVHQGGTGAADAFTARKNLGIGATALFAGYLNTAGVQQALAAGYSAYLVMGCPRDGNSLVTQIIPAAALTETAVRYQLADNLDYCAFEMWHVGGVPVIQKTGGSGAITAIFGIN